jgi:extracellular elastinolytic metalloproteinase
MFMFTAMTPARDAALSNDILMHELTHGLSGRLVGGNSNPNCLQSPQASGLSEGYSDAIAIMMQMNASDTPTTPKVVGEYVSNIPNGLRSGVYSTDMAVNNFTYNLLSTPNFQEVHNMGEVWTNMLNEVYWKMVIKSGFTPVPDLTDSSKSGTGNADYLQLLINSMKKQPCNPTFIQARDSMLAADMATNQGKYRCDIWGGFAKRGLGFGAVEDGAFVNNFETDPFCKPRE